jgi:membrane protein DedA with SNARE-associated domain
MITEFVTKVAVKVLETTGYAGAAGLMALESMIAPVPSEAVMPFVGFLVVDGKWNFWGSIAATSAGSIVGSLLSYLMGYYGGKPFVLKVGKYLLLNQRDLERTERFCHQRSGPTWLFVSRFIPVVRHLVSIPAGIGKMPIVPFLMATFAGATIWNTMLLVLGMKLREKWTIVQTYSHKIDYVVIAGAVIAIVWFVRNRRAEAARPPGFPDTPAGPGK